MKKANLIAFNSKEKENALNEVRILASIDHSYVISYYDAFIDVESESLCVIMEYAKEGDLSKKIQMHRKNNTFF